MEFMLQFNAKIVYIKGNDNTVADALSRLPVKLSTSSEIAIQTARSLYDFFPDDGEDSTLTINTVLPARDNCPLFTAHALAKTDIATTQAMRAVLSITQDPQLCTAIIASYETDSWCKKLCKAAVGMPTVHERDNLMFIGEQLVIPAVGNIHKLLFHLAHDLLGHFGFERSYRLLQNSYYWPNM